MFWQRKSEGEHEASRRLKTQFLIEMEGFDSGNEQILLIGDFLFYSVQKGTIDNISSSEVHVLKRDASAMKYNSKHAHY